MVVKLGPHGVLMAKPVETERKLESGIIVPQTQKQSKPKSKVLAVGKGTKDKPMEVSVGDVVTFNGAGTREVTGDNGEEYLVIDMSNCLWIEEK